MSTEQKAQPKPDDKKKDQDKKKEQKEEDLVIVPSCRVSRIRSLRRRLTTMLSSSLPTIRAPSNNSSRLSRVPPRP